jgi:hypothetical protein
VKTKKFIGVFIRRYKILLHAILIQTGPQISDSIASSVTYRWLSEFLSKEIELPERGADRSPPSNAEYKNY